MQKELRYIQTNNTKEQPYRLLSWKEGYIIIIIQTKYQGIIYCIDENFKDIAIEEIGEDRLEKYLKES